MDAATTTTADNTQTTDSTGTIEATYDRLHNIKELKFGFRSKKDETTGVETKRETIEVKVPILSVDGIIEVLKRGGKELDLLLVAVENVVTDSIKSRLADDPAINKDNFPLAEFSWEAIANQPESERKGRGIAKEVWEDFIKSYVAVMPGLTGKKPDNINKQAAILAQKLNPLKNHEDKEKLLPKFKEALTLYAENAPDAESFQDCIVFLVEKADRLLKADNEADLAANLGFGD